MECSKLGVNEINQVKNISKIHLIDLAGSERLAKSGAKGDTQKVPNNITISIGKYCNQ